MKKIGIFWIIGIELLWLLFTWWVILPAWNVQSQAFWFFGFSHIVMAIGIVLMLASPLLKTKFFREIRRFGYNKNGYKYNQSYDLGSFFRKGTWIITVIPITVIFGMLVSLLNGVVGAKIFRANAYQQLLPVTVSTAGDFQTDFNLDGGDLILPIIDKDVAYKRAQAQLLSYGAQYNIAYEYFTLINVKRNDGNHLLRVAPLEYATPIVALNRYNSGSVGYVEVDVGTGQARFVEVPGGMPYVTSAWLDHKVHRHLRFNHPTKLFNDYRFEVDDEGHPYWVVPTYRNAIAMFSGPVGEGVITLDAVTGETHYYDLGTEPDWIDRSVDDSILAEQAHNHLYFKEGWLNATFGQRLNVFQLSDGYNYFIKGDTTYFISGINSPNEADQTTVGFMAINLSTGEATTYPVSGITEMRAIEIVQTDARVSAQRLVASWPILINLAGVPTYFVVMRNDVQTEYYAFIDVATGANVSMKSSISLSRSEYLDKLAGSGLIENEVLTATLTVDRVLVLASENRIEFTVTNPAFTNMYFVVEMSLNVDARFLQSGDTIDINFKTDAGAGLNRVEALVRTN